MILSMVTMSGFFLTCGLHVPITMVACDDAMQLCYDLTVGVVIVEIGHTFLAHH